MKKLILLSLIIIAIGLNSCKKEGTTQTSQTDNSKLITGQWHWVEQTYQDYTNNVLTGSEDYTTILDPTSYFEFDANGTFIEKPQNTTNVLDSGVYHITGDTLYIKRNIDNNTSNYFIKKLTSSSLIIHLTTGVSPYRGEVEYTMKR